MSIGKLCSYNKLFYINYFSLAYKMSVLRIGFKNKLNSIDYDLLLQIGFTRLYLYISKLRER